MNRLQEVHEQTKQLGFLLDQEITSNNREDVINNLNQLIRERGETMNQILPPFTEDENRLGAEIYKMNKEIEDKMEKLFKNLKMEIRQVQKQKRTKDFYTNPYKDVQISDGTFMDSKK